MAGNPNAGSQLSWPHFKPVTHSSSLSQSPSLASHWLEFVQQAKPPVPTEHGELSVQQAKPSVPSVTGRIKWDSGTHIRKWGLVLVDRFALFQSGNGGGGQLP